MRRKEEEAILKWNSKFMLCTYQQEHFSVWLDFMLLHVFD